MNKRHKQDACGCLLISLTALGLVICAVARGVQEIKKRINKEPTKIEQRESVPYRIMPSHCR